jgi:hypothetical protein
MLEACREDGYDAYPSNCSNPPSRRPRGEQKRKSTMGKGYQTAATSLARRLEKQLGDSRGSVQLNAGCFAGSAGFFLTDGL